MRRLLALLVTLPLVLAGSLAAHQLGFGLAAPEAGRRARLLAESGHSYLTHLPIVLVVLLTAVAVAGCLAVRAELRDPGATAASRWPYALIAPGAFTLQECLERLLHTGALPVGLVTEPAFLLGLALQLPMALLAVVLAWLVLRSARRLARALGSRRPPRPAAAPTPWAGSAPAFVAPPRSSGLATCAAGRAPPVPATA